MKLDEIDVNEFIEFASVHGRRKPTLKYLLGMVSEGQMGHVLTDMFGAPDTRKIVRIIKNAPALVTGELISTEDKCKNPRHCVVGQLFFEAGMSNKRLKELQSRYGAGAEGLPVWAHQMLWKHYGLLPFQTNNLIHDNDNTIDADVEDEDSVCFVVDKEALIRTVEDFEEVQPRDIDDLIANTNHKGTREFLKPFVFKAYKEWVRLGVKAMQVQAKEYGRALTLKASKK